MDKLSQSTEPASRLTEMQQDDRAAQIASARGARMSDIMDSMWQNSIVPQMMAERQVANRKAADNQTVLPDFDF